MLGHKRVVRGNTAAQTFSLRNRLNDGSLPRVREAVETLSRSRDRAPSLLRKRSSSHSRWGAPGTGYHSSTNVLIKSRRRIAQRYLGGLFASDIITCVPVDVLAYLSYCFTSNKNKKLLRL